MSDVDVVAELEAAAIKVDDDVFFAGNRRGVVERIERGAGKPTLFTVRNFKTGGQHFLWAGQLWLSKEEAS